MSFLLFITLTFNAWSMMLACDHSDLELESERHIECAAHQDQSNKNSHSKSNHANHSGCLKFCCHFMPIKSEDSSVLLSGNAIGLISNEFFYIAGHLKNHTEQILRPPIV